jgi:hypothetical protein
MRSLALLLVLAPLVLSGCADSHNRFGDAGGDGGLCGPPSSLFCVSACGSDAGYPAVCTGGSWACPPGTRDITTCPPGCVGAPPMPGCVCRGTSWSCEGGVCPAGLNPWDPSDPLRRCTVEGATCSSGTGDACGGGLFCTCHSGLYDCAVAEPDPVCWCGRQPSEGDRCNEEGASCGECCPTPGGTGWPAMQCVEGHWTSAPCPAIECPVFEIECPVDTSTLLGRSCGAEGVTCGDSCCSSAVSCTGGTWVRGPEADCALCSEYACGEGHCRWDQACGSRCGPDDGIQFYCAPLNEGCSDCSCLILDASQRCEMIDGHPHISELGFCG